MGIASFPITINNIENKKQLKKIDKYPKKINIDYKNLLNFIEQEWKIEIENPESIWSIDNESTMELNYKKLKSRTGYLEREVAKHYKFSVNDSNHKHRCYSTQDNIASFYNKKYKKKMDRGNISRVENKVQNTLNILKVRFPKNIINPSHSKHSPGIRLLIPPSITKQILAIANVNSVNELKLKMRQELVVLSGELVVLSDELVVLSPSIINEINKLQNTLMYYLILSYVIKLKELTSNSLSLNSGKKFPEIQHAGESFEINKKGKTMIKKTLTRKNESFVSESKTLYPKKKLMSKEKFIENSSPKILYPRKTLTRKKIVKYEDYGLFPYSFYKHTEYGQYLKTCLEYLVKNNIEPMTNDQLFEIFTFWNNFCNKENRTYRMTFNTETKRFKETKILLTYKMNIAKINIDDIKRSITLFHKVCKTNNKLMYIKKIHLQVPFLWQTKRYNKTDWFTVCLLPETAAYKEIFGITPKYKKTFEERVAKSFADYFHNGAKKFAFKTIMANYLAFINFSDRMVKEHQERKMYTLTIDEYVDEFFQFAKEDTEWIKGPINVNYILSEKMKDRFFQYMRSAYGYEEFGKIKEKEAT